MIFVNTVALQLKVTVYFIISTVLSWWHKLFYSFQNEKLASQDKTFFWSYAYCRKHHGTWNSVELKLLALQGHGIKAQACEYFELRSFIMAAFVSCGKSSKTVALGTKTEEPFCWCCSLALCSLQHCSIVPKRFYLLGKVSSSVSFGVKFTVFCEGLMGKKHIVSPAGLFSLGFL